MEVFIKIQKQPSRVVLTKICSENMQPIYEKSPMLKGAFNKIAKNSYKSDQYFQNTFL